MVDMKTLTIGGTKFEIVDAEARADIASLQAAVGSPLVASTVSAMTDTSKIYVYTGSESGYTSGNWYYWNGSAWTSGGVYNAVAVSTDKTLSVEDQAADAKYVGDALATTNSKSIQLVDALKDILNNMMYLFSGVSFYNDDLDISGTGTATTSLISELSLALKIAVSIQATFNQGQNVIYSNASHNDLRPYLTVTVTYDDGSTATTTNYTISGSFRAGTTTFTVNVGELISTFTANITQADYSAYLLYELPETTVFDGTNVIDTGLTPVSGASDSDWTILGKLSFEYSSSTDWPSQGFFGWNYYSISTGYVKCGMGKKTQAGGRKITYDDNTHGDSSEALNASYGTQEISFVVLRNSTNGTSHFEIHWNGQQIVNVTRNDEYKTSNAKLYIGSSTSTPSFIGTFEDFKFYSTKVDAGTIESYLEG